MTTSLFDTGIRPAIDEYLAQKAAEKRDYGDYWSASSAGYCMRKLIFDRLKVPHTKEADARKTRVFESGHIFHEFLQGITKNAGLSIASEVELQDEDLMVRGHFDDLVLVGPDEPDTMGAEGMYDFHHAPNPGDYKKHLILYDYKTQNSRAFTYQKGKPMSYYHMMQLGTYMYMLKRLTDDQVYGNEGFIWEGQGGGDSAELVRSLTEARILKISKDDLRMSEDVLYWDEKLEAEVVAFWTTLNEYWANKQVPKCTCADQEGGFLAREKFNDYFYEDTPCSLEWLKLKVKEGAVKW